MSVQGELLHGVKRIAKFAAIAGVRALSQTARLLPIHPRRIVFISHRNGSQYADSPMFITEKLLADHPDEFELVWVFNDPTRFAHLRGRGIKLVKSKSLADFYYSNTARVYVSNLFGPRHWVIKRHNKLNVETTHGVAYKSLLSNGIQAREVSFLERLPLQWKINTSNLCLSGNRITTDMVYRDELGYKGEILECGLPRNDVFFGSGEQERARVLSHFGLKDSQQIVLVMPTWKQDQGRANIELDYTKLVEKLSERYGGEWVVLLRLHHLSTVDISDILATYSGCVFDATKYPNSQDLLCAGNVLITDYSSVIWDFALRKLPILIYAPDRDAYGEDRGFNVPPEEWGLVQSSTQDELLEAIDTHSYEDLCEASQAHLERFGSCETGHATEVVCKSIVSHCS